MTLRLAHYSLLSGDFHVYIYEEWKFLTMLDDPNLLRSCVIFQAVAYIC